MVSAYFGGIFDRIMMELTSIAMALPSLPIAILLVAYLQPSIKNLIIAICLTEWTSIARIVRARVLALKELPFVKAEKSIGARSPYILVRHIFPNILEIVFVRGVMAVAGAMLTEASLSFLGLGVLGMKSWGGILRYAFFRNGVLNGYWWWYVPPIVCISAAVLSFMLLGYGKGNAERSGR
jgi:peptide/nickel transport system permease protein